MCRPPQKAFNPSWKGAYKTRPAGFTKHFYQWKNFIFRKGFLYKTFSIKQLETGQEIKPSLEERAQFLEIFEQNTTNNVNINNQGQDSSEQETEETRQFFRSDKGHDLAKGDKIRVVHGELIGATGIVQHLEGENVVFKPTNLEDFTDNLSLQSTSVVKYFEVGDMVRIIQGKYNNETGIVVNV